MPSWRKSSYTKSVSANKHLGGGVINELSHDVDILFMLFNKIKPIYGFKQKVSDLIIDVEDSAYAIFEAYHSNKKFYIFLNMDFYRHDSTRKCTVIGSKGTIIWDGISNQIKIYMMNKKTRLISFNKNKNNSYLNEMKYFINNIRKKNTLYNKFKQNLEVVKVLDNMKKKNYK